MSLLDYQIIFEEMVEDAQNQAREEDEIEKLFGLEDDEEEEIQGNPFGMNNQDDFDDFTGDVKAQQNAFELMKDLMDKYKEFCSACETAWKVQEIPAVLRQRLITLDQKNQDNYQKLYTLVKKYANTMKESEIKND